MDLEKAIVGVTRRTTILMGDFTYNLNTLAGLKLVKLMKSLRMSSQLPVISSTTRSGSQIDCIFTGIQGVEAYISTTLPSYHDPILVFVPAPHLKTDVENETLKDLLNLQISKDLNKWSRSKTSKV